VVPDRGLQLARESPCRDDRPGTGEKRGADMEATSRHRTRAARRDAPLWLPWIAAPAFMLLPIGGCGIAASFGPAAPGSVRPVAGAGWQPAERSLVPARPLGFARADR